MNPPSIDWLESLIIKLHFSYYMISMADMPETSRAAVLSSLKDALADLENLKLVSSRDFIGVEH